MSAVEFGPLGMYRASSLVNVRSMIFIPSGEPSWFQSVGSVMALNASRIWVTRAETSAALMPQAG